MTGSDVGATRAKLPKAQEETRKEVSGAMKKYEESQALFISKYEELRKDAVDRVERVEGRMEEVEKTLRDLV